MAFPCLKCVCVYVGGGGGGGVARTNSGFATGLVPLGGYSHFSSYVGLGPVSTVYPQKILGISRKYLNFLQPP